MAKQNNSLTELQALEGIYEHLSTIDNLSEEVGKMSTRLSKIEQAHNTTLTTVTSFTKSMTQSFEEMKKAKAAEASISVYRKEDVTMTVRSEVKSVVSEVRSDFNRYINQIVDTHKRPPLINIRMNLSAKVLSIILAIEIFVGVVAYFWYINTPMYLGNELYHSYERLNYPNPGAGYHNAHQLVSAGERKQLRYLIRASENKERSYIAYCDTLQQLLNDKSIYINRIQYKNTERLIDYTDSTDIIKTAHFRKDGVVRITDDQRVNTLENVSHKGIQWIKVR